MHFETVIYEKADKVATVILNRPERLNAIDTQMHQELYRIWEDVEADNDVWVVVLTGNGRAFTSGADVKEIGEAYIAGSEIKRWDMKLAFKPGIAHGYQKSHGMWGIPEARDMSKPIITAVNGICAGAGLSIVAQTDIIICSDDATFFDPHVSVGQAPVHEVIEFATRAPKSVALRMAFMGLAERMGAQRAYELGIVTEIVPRDQLMARAQELAATIVERSSPLALRVTKQAFYRSYNMFFEDSLEMSKFYSEKLKGTNDQREGPKAWVQKRKPNWTAS
jgi:enoyl-CoA hydratase/carnithine racemase